jgi:hypothetical protein
MGAMPGSPTRSRRWVLQKTRHVGRDGLVRHLLVVPAAYLEADWPPYITQEEWAARWRKAVLGLRQPCQRGALGNGTGFARPSTSIRLATAMTGGGWAFRQNFGTERQAPVRVCSVKIESSYDDVYLVR